VRKKRSPFLRILILAILIKDGSTHGYALYKRILYHTRMKWKPSIGTIYRTLNEMVKEGLILKHIENRKRSYTVTPKGLDYFIKNSKAPLTKMAGVLATALEAYLKISSINPDMPSLLTKDLKERLKNLKKVLQKYDS